MKDDKEFTGGNAFDPREHEETVRIELPELYAKEEAGRPPREHRIIFLAAVAAVTAVVCLWIFLATGREAEPIEVPLPSETAEEWRGAFADRSIYDTAMECSVGLRTGRAGQVRYWSGVIISEDGWIATSAQALEETDRGRIYVTLNDGREYAAESILKDGAAAAVKISAAGLSAPEVSDRAVHSGEGIIAVSGGEYVTSGEISGISGEGARINSTLGSESEGAPVFDTDGRLMGIAAGVDGTPELIFVGAFDTIIQRIQK